VLIDAPGSATLRAVPRPLVEAAIRRHTVAPRAGAALPA
jgi:hypothetical protein